MIKDLKSLRAITAGEENKQINKQIDKSTVSCTRASVVVPETAFSVEHASLAGAAAGSAREAKASGDGGGHERSDEGRVGGAEELVEPAAGDEHAREHVDEPDEQAQEALALVPDEQQDRLDVELEEDARHVALADGPAVLRHGVLVREDEVVGSQTPPGRRRRRERRDLLRRNGRVDGRHDRQVVLELVEVLGRGGDGQVERVPEVRVQRPEGELVDDVREVEC